MKRTKATAGGTPAELPEQDGAREDAEARAELLSCLRSKSAEIEQELVATYMEMDQTVGTDPEWFVSIVDAVRASVELAAAIIERGEGWEPDLPPAIKAMARMLARKGFELEATVRGTHAATSIFLRSLSGEFSGPPPDAIRYLFAQARRVEGLVTRFAEEYEAEMERVDSSPARRLAENVERLLAGKSADLSALAYDMQGWHLGLIAVGAGADVGARSLSERLGCRLLHVGRDDGTAWVWLGTEKSTSFDGLEQLVSSGACGPLACAAGEPRQGAEGWRLTHREAQIALGVMLRSPRPFVRSSDVLLPAAVIADDEIHGFVQETYLAPLRRARDAEALRETLRTYFDCAGNAASTGAALGIDRHTVQRRLRRIERILGRPLETCRAELDVALRTEQLDGANSAGEQIAS